MACAYFSAVLLIIVKICGVKLSVFITDKPVAVYLCGVKLNLDLCIFCNCYHCRTHLVDKNFLCLHHWINIWIVSVSAICKSLHARILNVSCAKAKYRQKYTCFFFLFYKILKFIGIRYSNVKITVSSHDDSVYAAFNEIVGSDLISSLHSALSVGASVCAETVDGPLYFILVTKLFSLKNHFFFSRIGNDWNRSFARIIVDKLIHALLKERKFITWTHRARYIYQENKITLGKLFCICIFRL